MLQHLLCQALHHCGYCLPSRCAQGFHLFEILPVSKVLAILKKCLLLRIEGLSHR